MEQNDEEIEQLDNSLAETYVGQLIMDYLSGTVMTSESGRRRVETYRARLQDEKKHFVIPEMSPKNPDDVKVKFREIIERLQKTHPAIFDQQVHDTLIILSTKSYDEDLEELENTTKMTKEEIEEILSTKARIAANRRRLALSPFEIVPFEKLVNERQKILLSRKKEELSSEKNIQEQKASLENKGFFSKVISIFSVSSGKVKAKVKAN